jgi:hypothetical protein
MSKRLVISVTVFLIVGIAIGILGVMLVQALHPLAPAAVPHPHSHW